MRHRRSWHSPRAREPGENATRATSRSRAAEDKPRMQPLSDGLLRRCGRHLAILPVSGGAPLRRSTLALRISTASSSKIGTVTRTDKIQSACRSAAGPGGSLCVCACAIRITVLKVQAISPATNVIIQTPRKFGPSSVLCHEVGIWCVPAIFERRRGRLGSKISGCGQLAEVAVYFAMSGLPRKQTPIGSRRHVSKSAIDRDRGEPRGSAPPTPPYVRVRIRRFEKLR